MTQAKLFYINKHSLYPRISETQLPNQFKVMKLLHATLQRPNGSFRGVEKQYNKKRDYEGFLSRLIFSLTCKSHDG